MFLSVTVSTTEITNHGKNEYRFHNLNPVYYRNGLLLKLVRNLQYPSESHTANKQS